MYLSKILAVRRHTAAPKVTAPFGRLFWHSAYSDFAVGYHTAEKTLRRKNFQPEKLSRRKYLSQCISQKFLLSVGTEPPRRLLHLSGGSFGVRHIPTLLSDITQPKKLSDERTFSRKNSLDGRNSANVSLKNSCFPSAHSRSEGYCTFRAAVLAFGIFRLCCRISHSRKNSQTKELSAGKTLSPEESQPMYLSKILAVRRHTAAPKATAPFGRLFWHSAYSDFAVGYHTAEKTLRRKNFQPEKLSRRKNLSQCISQKFLLSVSTQPLPDIVMSRILSCIN